MQHFLTWCGRIILALILLCACALAVMNRAPVAVAVPGYTVDLPLYLLVYGVLALGMVCGCVLQGMFRLGQWKRTRARGADSLS